MPTLALALFLALGARPASGDGAKLAPPVEVRVLAGRATLLRGTEVLSRSAAMGAQAIEGPVELEVGPSSTVEVLWRGRGSLRVEGPAAVSLPDSSKTPLAPRVELLFAASVELEVRRGSVVADLGACGELALARCAVALSELPTGGWDLLHRGGAALAFRPAGAVVSRAIASGARLRLEPPVDPTH